MTQPLRIPTIDCRHNRLEAERLLAEARQALANAPMPDDVPHEE